MQTNPLTTFQNPTEKESPPSLHRSDENVSRGEKNPFLIRSICSRFDQNLNRLRAKIMDSEKDLMVEVSFL